LISVNDLTDLWGKFVIKNDAVLDALIDLGEEEQFSSSTEIETNDLLVSAKAMANRFSSSSYKTESPPEAPNFAMGSEAAGSSDGPSKSSEGQSLVTPFVQSSHSVRLPEIPLHRFEGEVADWPVFRDRFVALVDSRSNISNIEKFYYLLSCLQCEASDVVKGITVSNDTYSIAWAALVQRYDQPRRLASSLIESILSAPLIPQESVASLSKFLNVFDENIAILDSLEIPDLGDFLLFSVAFRSLPVLSRRLFETTNTNEYPKVQELFKFVKSRIQVLELAGGTSSTDSKATPSKPQRKRPQRPTTATSLTVVKSTGAPPAKSNKCPDCNGLHHLSNCPVFKGLSVDGRYEVVSKYRLCMSCFSNQHWSNKCQEVCPKCKRRHHQLLHRDVQQNQDKAVEQSSAVLFSSHLPTSVLLGTAIVFIKDSGGGIQPVRAILDSGSQISVITAKCSDRLGLRRSRWTASVTGLSGQSVPDVLGTVNLAVRPHHDIAPVITM